MLVLKKQPDRFIEWLFLMGMYTGQTFDGVVGFATLGHYSPKQGLTRTRKLSQYRLGYSRKG